jgi:cytoskeletal protein RodZ
MQYKGENMDTNDRTILRRLILALVLIVLPGAVIWIFFIRNADKKPANQKKGTDTAQQTGDTSNPATNQPATNPQTQQGVSQPGVTSPTAQGPQPTTLANTGPGNVGALFVSASLIGGFAHFLYNRRRRSSVI